MTRYVLAPPGINPLEADLPKRSRRGLPWWAWLAGAWALAMGCWGVWAWQARAASASVPPPPGHEQPAAETTPTATPSPRPPTATATPTPTTTPSATGLMEAAFAQWSTATPAGGASLTPVVYPTHTGVPLVATVLVTQIVYRPGGTNTVYATVEVEVPVTVVVTAPPGPTDEPMVITATPGPTQTPWVLVVTATPEPEGMDHRLYIPLLTSP